MALKKCSSCKEAKPRNSFSKNSSAKDSLQNCCKECSKKIEEANGKVSKEAAIKYIEQLTLLGHTYVCKCCGEAKLADKFYHQRKRGTVKVADSKCKDCQADYQRKKSFGITQTDYDNLLKAQGGCCAICRIPHADYQATSYKGKCFAVDHCHKRGVIRGLLCDKCNRALGFLDDKVEYLLRAVKYLEGDDIV